MRLRTPRSTRKCLSNEVGVISYCGVWLAFVSSLPVNELAEFAELFLFTRY